MTSAELRKIERDLSDENSLLRTQNARLRAELSRTVDAWHKAKEAETRLRALAIRAQRDLHNRDFYGGHGVGTMAECLHPDCQEATKCL